MRSHLVAFGAAAVLLGIAAVVGLLAILYVIHAVTSNL